MFISLYLYVLESGLKPHLFIEKFTWNLPRFKFEKIRENPVIMQVAIILCATIILLLFIMLDIILCISVCTL